MSGVPAGDGGRVRTVFLGSGAFAVPILARLAAHPLAELVGVVTAPPRPVGRRQVPTPTPVGALAESLGVDPILTPSRLRDASAIASILALRPGLAVLADYGQIVPPALLDLPHGALNVHPSALPRWRGASPVQATILAGDPSTAVTLMRMDEGWTRGRSSRGRPWRSRDETAPDLKGDSHARGRPAGARAAGWLDGPCVRRRSHGGCDADPAAAPRGRPARTRRGRRGCSSARCGRRPWPGSFLDTDGERLVVAAASVAPSEPADQAGRLVRAGEWAGPGSPRTAVVLERATPRGRRAMAGADWLRGGAAGSRAGRSARGAGNREGGGPRAPRPRRLVGDGFTRSIPPGGPGELNAQYESVPERVKLWTPVMRLSYDTPVPDPEAPAKLAGPADDPPVVLADGVLERRRRRRVRRVQHIRALLGQHQDVAVGRGHGDRAVVEGSRRRDEVEVRAVGQRDPRQAHVGERAVAARAVAEEGSGRQPGAAKSALSRLTHEPLNGRAGSAAAVGRAAASTSSSAASEVVSSRVM